MKRIIIAATVLATTACSSMPAPATAQQPASEQPRTLSVNANASVQRAPDRAVVRLAVETIANTADEASARNAETMQRMLSAIRALGIDADDIQTQRVSLHPRYDQSRDARSPEIVAYQAVNQVVVTLEDVTRVGEVVDASVRAGANRVIGVEFGLSDPESAYHEALRLAVEKARREASTLASALGESLGPALSVSTGGYSPPVARPMPEMAMARMDAAAPPPVEPGELDVTAFVSITYRLGS
jgi:uncharacterized protein YggE